MRNPCTALVLLVWLSLSSLTHASPLPKDHEYDPSVSHPEAILGVSAGDWFLRPEQLEQYFQKISTESAKIRLESQGRTYEQRQQWLAIISSPENLAQLDRWISIKAKLRNAPAEVSKEDRAALPSIVWLGYGIHGDEPSGSNAAPYVAYHLIASEDPRVKAWLKEVIVLIDPSLNPDGMARYASWANMYRGKQFVGDRWHRQHRQQWPTGRTNHYWFDLNRDWLLAQHPESVHRLKTYHRWLPNLSGDYHEMGTRGTYFFQPGVPSRENPLKPKQNLQLTELVAKYHAAALDAEGELYYSRQSFDDFYPGKGSTYPDLTGGVGVLFEQASTEGHVIDRARGRLTFARAIRNQWLTSMSMIKAGAELKNDLIDFQFDFFSQASRFAKNQRASGWLLAGSPGRLQEVVRVLKTHQIKALATSQPMNIKGQTYPSNSVWISADQPQARLIASLFSVPAEFESKVFYDVSTWTFPLAFGLQYAVLNLDQKPQTGGFWEAPAPASFSPSLYYAIKPGDLESQALALACVKEGAFVAFSRRSFQPTQDGESFPPGTLMFRATKKFSAEALYEKLKAWSERHRIHVHGLASAATAEGIDLGSPDMVPLTPVSIALVAGPGVSSSEAGELWFLLDRRLGIAVTLLEPAVIGRAPLDQYTHLVLPNGNYEDWTDSTVDKIKRWVREGGILMTQREAAFWANSVFQKGRKASSKETSEAAANESSPETAGDKTLPPQIPWAVQSRERAKNRISGAAFEILLDLTHPLAAGYQTPSTTAWRQGVRIFDEPRDPLEVVARYSLKPKLAGYASQLNQDKIAGTPAMLMRRYGSGVVVQSADNPAFRAYWMATQPLWVNALLYSKGTLMGAAEEEGTHE